MEGLNWRLRRTAASGRTDERRLLSLHSDAQRQRLDSFSSPLSFAFHHPFSVVGRGREGRTPLLGRKESNLKVEGVELIYIRNGRIEEENKES